MKFTSPILALAVSQTSLWSASAFSVQPSRTSVTALASSLQTAPGQIGTGYDEELPASQSPEVADRELAKFIDTPKPETIQGGALRTWSYSSPDVERMLVSMNTEGTLGGNPLESRINLCQGPNNAPLQLKIKSGKGQLRPVRLVIEAPGDHSSLFIYNISPMEFPFKARVQPASEIETPDVPVVISHSIYDMPSYYTLQGGGAVYTQPLDPSVKKAKVVLKTDGERPLKAAVELSQGPNAVKVLIEVYTEDGMERPFCTIIETPGAGNMIRAWSTGSAEFPLAVSVVPYE